MWVRARVLLVVAALAAAAWFGFRHRSGGSKRPAGGESPTGDDAPVTVEPARDPDAGIARPLAEAPGVARTIAMLGAPAAQYAALVEDDEADQTYRALVDQSGGGARYDRELSRAAREVAYQAAVRGTPPPEAMLTTLLHASGAAEISAMQLIVHANSDAASVLAQTVRRALARTIDGHGPVRVGIGEVTTPDEEMSYHVAVLVTRRAYEIDPAPRYAALGTTWTLRGRLPSGYSNAKAWAMYPDGRIAEAEITTRGRRFELTAATGNQKGTLYVSISGTDDSGPGKLLQLAIEVGVEPSRELDVVVPPPDPELDDLAAAEAHALALLNADRARFGIAPLAPDARLADIARAHSNDLRDNAFFAHLSPRTGLAGDRLASAGYRARSHAENLARNDSITEAQASLLGSIGHRRNVLNPKLTHVGLGLARKTRDDATDWYVTQLFAVPVEPLDQERAIAEVLSKIDNARAAGGNTALAREADLAAIAQRNARLAADGPLDGLQERAAGELRGLPHRAATISVHAVHDLAVFEPPKMTLDEEMGAIGVGVFQSETDLHGRIGIVLIVSPH